MKEFCIKISVFLALIAGVTYAVFYYLAQDPTDLDMFYPKVSQGTTNYLILGSSAAFHGLEPNMVFDGFAKKDEGLNFAFSNATSPYGKVYLDNIKKKVKTTSTQKGVFVLEVNPFNISVKDSTIKKLSDFRENELFLNRIRNINTSPNIEYLSTIVEKPLYFYLTRKLFSIEAQSEVKRNGWFENTKLKAPLTSAEIKRRENHKKKTIATYRKDVFPYYQFSETRLNSFLETIAFLKNYGEIYVVELPVSKEMQALRDEYMSDFSKKIEGLAKEHHFHYYNLIEACPDCTTVDGNHLIPTDAFRISKLLNERMRVDRK